MEFRSLSLSKGRLHHQPKQKKMARRPFVRGFPGFRLRSIPTLRFGMAPPPLQSLPLPRLQTIIISFNFFCGKHLCKASVSQVWAPLPAKSLVAGPSDGKNQGILPKGSLLAFFLRPTTKDFSFRCAQNCLPTRHGLGASP